MSNRTPTLTLTEKDFKRTETGEQVYVGTPFNTYNGNIVIDASFPDKEDCILWRSTPTEHGKSLAIRGYLKVNHAVKLRFDHSLSASSIEGPDADFWLGGTMFTSDHGIKVGRIHAKTLHAGEGRVVAQEIDVISDAIAGSFAVTGDLATAQGDIHAKTGDMETGGSIISGGSIVVAKETKAGRNITAIGQIDSEYLVAALSIQSGMFIRAAGIAAGLTIAAGVGAIDRFIKNGHQSKDFDPLLNWPGEKGLRIDAIVGMIRAGTVVSGTRMGLHSERQEYMTDEAIEEAREAALASSDSEDGAPAALPASAPRRRPR